MWMIDGVILDQPGVLHGSGADLHWSKWDGSSGNPFGGYEVHRSTDPNFTVSAANLVTTIGELTDRFRLQREAA